MFPFGIFPFNISPMANPWWPVQLAQMQTDAEKNMPDAWKPYMEAYATWVELMTKNNPWLAFYNDQLKK